MKKEYTPIPGRVDTCKRIIKEGHKATMDSWKKFCPEEYAAALSEIRRGKLGKL